MSLPVVVKLEQHPSPTLHATVEDDSSTPSSSGTGSGTEPAPGSSTLNHHHHHLTATGVIATTTTALVHNRLTHAAGGMLSSTATGLLTLLLVLFVYRKSFLLPFSSSNQARNLSLTEYNTEFNRHIGASGTASGRAPPPPQSLGSAGAARRSFRSPPSPHYEPRSHSNATSLAKDSSNRLRITLDQDQTVGEEGEVYRCIIKTPVPHDIKPCLRRNSPVSPDRDLNHPPSHSSSSTRTDFDTEHSDSKVDDATTSSSSEESNSTTSLTKKSVRLVEPSNSAIELGRLRSQWAACAASPLARGIGGYRSTRDIYAKGQGGDQHPSTDEDLVPSPIDFGVDGQNNSLGLLVPAPSPPHHHHLSTPNSGPGSSIKRRSSPSPLGRFAKDSLRSNVHRSASPIPGRLTGPAYLRNASPAGSPNGSSSSNTRGDSNSPSRPKWIKKKTSANALGSSSSAAAASASIAATSPIEKKNQTVVTTDGTSEDSEGFEDCSEGSGASTPVYQQGTLHGLNGDGLRMSELIARVVELPTSPERVARASLDDLSTGLPTAVS